MATVSFRNVSFSYGDNKIIDNLSLEISNGEIMGIIGPSGCGKTTLIRLLCGFITPDDGEIYIGDTCVFHSKRRINIPPENRNIGVVFQDYAVWPHLSVIDNVIYPLKKKRVNKKEREETALKALQLVNMEEYANHLPSQLSGGQQQRVAIARALVSSKELLILDEPITNLDLKLREQMLEEVRNIQNTIHTTIIYISHDQEASLQLCDRLAIMDNNGYIRQIGNDYEIVMHPKDRFIYDYIGVSNYLPISIENNDIIIEHIKGKSVYQDHNFKYNADDTYELAIRPMDIEITNDKTGFPAKIVSATFLGNITNYFVQLGESIIRVQRPALDTLRDGIYSENDLVYLKFNNTKLFKTKGE